MPIVERRGLVEVVTRSDLLRPPPRTSALGRVLGRLIPVVAAASLVGVVARSDLV